MPWTEITRPQYERCGRRYASDASDAETDIAWGADDGRTDDDDGSGGEPRKRSRRRTRGQDPPHNDGRPRPGRRRKRDFGRGL